MFTRLTRILMWPSGFGLALAIIAACLVGLVVVRCW